MRKILSATALAALVFAAHAPVAFGTEFIGNRSIDQLRMTPERVYIRTDAQPAETCTIFNAWARLELTPGNMFMAQALLEAKIHNKRVSIWYTASTAPGSDQDTGCDASTISEVTVIRID